MTTTSLTNDSLVWPHRWAVVTACAMFPLLIVGGLVTTYDAGMAVPDWPNTYGYNLLVYPWQSWLSGPWDLFIEHGHRLLGTLVGICAIGLVVASWRATNSRQVRGVSSAVLAGVIAQGLLGGARVLADERWIAFAHGCFAPAVFALTVYSVRLTSATDPSAIRNASVPRALAIPVALAAYFQLCLGAVLRHLALVLPPSGFRAALVFHLVVAGLLVVLVARLVWTVGRQPDAVARSARRLAVWVALQLLLGSSTWIVNYGWPSWLAQWPATAGFVVPARSLMQSLVTTAHVGLGAWIVATSANLACAARGARAARSPAMSRSMLTLGVAA